MPISRSEAARVAIASVSAFSKYATSAITQWRAICNDQSRGAAAGAGNVVSLTTAPKTADLVVYRTLEVIMEEFADDLLVTLAAGQISDIDLEVRDLAGIASLGIVHCKSRHRARIDFRLRRLRNGSCTPGLQEVLD